ncbi:hypothetical protein [Kineosporia sp. NBRC 101731]|uniref:hypothetical protein n=1 Tax=Kineosporia sp. NBRC 101731 TaxID=3032199 RepID=UPI0024A15172|nr:hypothetical protein [Kineosporia sp. NBRC 101731]GLY31533.1 hypothetical protein Kisp02_48980 [Kineosporia sp. NBRC 101731]
MSSDHFSVDTEKMRAAGRELEAKGVELQNIHAQWFRLMNQARSAMGSDNNGRAMARQLGDNSNKTGVAVKSFALAVRRGGQALQGAADAFVATEDGATQAAKNLGKMTGAAGSVGDVSTGNTSGSSTNGSSSDSKPKTTGKH